MIKVNLSTLLGKRKWKQADLKRHTGVRPNTISDLYNEEATAISFHNLELICKALECDISDLLEIVSEPSPDEANRS